ncbi:MAG TPA: hypothetical protein VGP72_13220 [Planctomycetota bacterium]|jgi:hypothetical protein
MKTSLAAGFLLALCFACCGCNERDDKRTSEEKLNTPALNLESRPVMACPECGAPQRPYRINATKSYYRCTGAPPKFVHHDEKTWSHKVKDDR